MTERKLTGLSRRALLAGASGLAVGVLAARPVWAQARATRLRLGLQEKTTRLVVDLSERVTWRTFALDNPPRLILDLPQVEFDGASAPAALGTVRAVRTGPGDPGVSRIVIDLTGPAIVDKDFLLEPQSGFGWRLVVDLVGVDRSAFLATVGKVPVPVAPKSVTPEPSTRAAGLAPAQGSFPTPTPTPTPAPVAPALAAPAPAALPAPLPAPLPAIVQADPAGGPVDLRPGTLPAGGGRVLPASFDPALEPSPDPSYKAVRAQPAPPAASTRPDPDLPEAQAGGPVMVRLADGQRVPVPPRKPAVPAGAAVAATVAAQPVRRPTIVLDPGHGGRDPGAISPSGQYEKDITLTMGRELRKALEGTGRYRVVMTRTDDRSIALRDRIALGRQAEGDLFISLHADAMRDLSVRGLSVYTLSETASDAEAGALAERENKADILLNADLSNQSPDVANILIDLAQRATMNNSALFANTLIRNLPADVRKLIKTHRSAGFAVLKAPDMPSVLVEMGFLSNQADENLLRTAAYRSKLADAIVRSIDDYTVLQQQRAGRP